MGAARGKTAGGASTAGSGRHLGVCCSTVASVVLERGSRRLSPVSQGPLQNFLGNVVFHDSRVRCLLVLFKARPLRPGSLFPCSSSFGVWVCLHTTSVGLHAAKVDDVHGKALTRTQNSQPSDSVAKTKGIWAGRSSLCCVGLMGLAFAPHTIQAQLERICGRHHCSFQFCSCQG